MNIFIINLGNRDLTLNIGNETDSLYLPVEAREKGSEALPTHLQCAPGVRFIAEHLLNNLAEYQDQIKFPILYPVLELALKEVSRLDKVILICTDQVQTAVKPEDYSRDTINSGLVLKQILPQVFPAQIGEVIVARLTKDPHLYKEAYEAIDEILNNHCAIDQVTTIFAGISGGIPATNSTLQHHVIELYGVKARLIQMAEPTGAAREQGILGIPTLIDTWLWRKDSILRVLKTLLDRYDYSGALRLLEAEQITDSIIRDYLKHAQARFNLDFQAAHQALKAYSSGKPHQWKLSAQEFWARQRLADLGWIAQILLEKEDFTGFLTRVACLAENALCHLVWHSINIQVEGKTIMYRDIQQYDQELADRLLNRFGKYNILADKQAFNSILDQTDILLKKHSSPDKTTKTNEIRAILGQLDKLCLLRNKAIHQIKGVSKADLAQALPNIDSSFKDICQKMIAHLEILEKLAGHYTHYLEPERLFQNINKEILLRFKEVIVPLG